MTHCTVCGAAAREGAKFCTSCGARLVDTVTATPESGDTAAVAAVEPAAEPSMIDQPDESSDDQPEPDSTWAPVVTGDATGEVESEPAEPAYPEADVAEPTESPEYTASWPSGEEENVEPVPAEPLSDTPDSTETTWSSWSSASDDSITREAPESFATDADQDAGQHESRRAESDGAGLGEPWESGTMEESHRGASAWESWAPTASGPATVPASSGDVGASVRRLLDDLADRIDRLIDPAPVEKRGVDADDLADQLDRWSSASTDADGLLEVVRAVRTSPRDVDALTRLADRAPDLELLVRHYQAITTSSGEWSRKLRDQRSSNADDA